MLIVVGSRHDGNSMYLARKIKESLDEDMLHSTIIVPGNQRIHLCTGCMDCEESGVCDFIDDMKSNIEKIEKEDVLLLITPTRWNSLSGDLKIFIDRLNPLYSRKSLKGKKGIAISIGAKAKDEYSSKQATESLRDFFEAAEMDCILTHEFDKCLKPSDIASKQQEIDTLIEDIKKII